MKVPGGFDSFDAFFEAFSDTVGGLISYVDAAGRVQFASKALQAWLDLPPGQIRGRTLPELYGPDAYAQFAPWTDRALAGEDVHYERQATRRDGNSVWLSVNLRPHRDAAGRSNPPMICSSVVLPEPLVPRMAETLPRGTSRSTPFRTARRP
jgi:PAS domain S-box-containing protein